MPDYIAGKLPALAADRLFAPHGTIFIQPVAPAY
ncbi:hypothetical protein EHW99_1455 [Erwinia amylovora]|uniref:Uncharacterized protein n=2 Tax=Erwinia amylovora TaxID=552 RepID=A0A831A396_ERWAM|nr:hypothetical protein EaACW_2142 [Erwinia amylovora ACW56400]QJQ54160.1 hypothetical protein EHX00_1455 [Erwinia amylovora]CBA21117.1 hypothetical protein predicted by Glimmer/Critica [Erwinia amylovora CFBP1430]CCO78988.1 hypothetical protein BN432_2195 [Erwinia amylovora Ea356]CCO82789.1 hypothetical protein BN433_2223 [Erwinia amylovora Ea266]CCO86564.1 hypothetical protein BN434_2181 [Erwinia amylovora CFBP 2585]CCO90353.1 hypothetical protein BN435_2187 [Erwinia amylovora 01SFR-BO]CCO